MVLRHLLTRGAASAPVPVFAVAGAGSRDSVQDLRLGPDLRLVDTPASATVLLVAGAVPEPLSEPLARVHDAMPHPRCTVFWPPGNVKVHPPSILQDPVIAEGDARDTIVAAHRALLLGTRPSEAAILPDVDPAPWRGVGPYGQGGSGMTGGVPYGRPLAELGADRDGLRLDVLPLTVGPFFPRFPPGLRLDLKLAGDVVVEASIGPNPYADPNFAHTSGVQHSLFTRALSERVAIAELELARARHHLRWLADALAGHGLAALGTRVLRLAAHVQPGDGPLVRRLSTAVTWTQVLRWSTRGVGHVASAALAGLGLGPVARAAGVPEDLRADDPAYRALGFEPLVQRDGDAAARWRQRFDEAAQSLDLAARADDVWTEPVGRTESPRGRLEFGSSPTTRLLPLVPALLHNMEWGDAVTTLVSLDLDLEEAALAERSTLGAAA